MRDGPGTNDSGDTVQPLAVQALLYASGGLAEADAAAFERRLAADQAACEALAQAVPLALALRGQPVAPPDPAYRARVRQRLLRPAFRGHPALWAGLGAAAAVLVMLGLGTMARLPPRPPPGLSASSTLVGPANREAETASVMADVWAELQTPEHLLKAHDEEMRRRGRAEERGHSFQGEQRRSRSLGNSNSKH
jgi:anti-sigma factor RsiW